MKETALFVGWGGVYPGREKLALEGYHEWIKVLEEEKAKGEIDDFQTVLLGPYGGDIDGFTLVFGHPMKLMQLSQREDIHVLQLLGEREFARFVITPATLGDAVERDFKLVEEEILPMLERTPIPV